MKVLKDVYEETRVLYHHKKSGFWVALFFFINKLISKMYIHFAVFMFKRRWLVKRNGVEVFDFNGAIMPVIKVFSYTALLKSVFEDTFFVSCFYGDNYDKKTVTFVDSITAEGPYGYRDDILDVTVKAGDVVIDAGAWAGDFGAYCASKGAVAYCFEPAADIYAWLCETAKLNQGKIIPVKKALGEKEETGYVDNAEEGNTAAKIVMEGAGEKVEITTLDAFVAENNLSRIDFVKSDIEGFERFLLKGGTNVLRTFAPKLAICTYHLPDDPQVLADIIRKANPRYKIVQMRHKLFAAVV